MTGDFEDVVSFKVDLAGTEATLAEIYLFAAQDDPARADELRKLAQGTAQQGAALYGSVSQWLSAYERAVAEAATPSAKPPAKVAVRPVPAPRPRKLNYREQQEWEGMEAAITAAEQVIA